MTKKHRIRLVDPQGGRSPTAGSASRQDKGRWSSRRKTEVVIQFLRDQIRLPTEAEWEFACRAGTQTPFYNGSTDDSSLGSIAWYADNSPDGTHAVGGRAANGFGLHDMLGNVWEWVHDRWSGYPSTPQVNPSTPPGGSQLDRVFRGGDWTSGSGVTRASFRTPIQPGLSSSVGFRIAMSP